MLNKQKPEPQVKNAARGLDVHSIFYTIQGEGPFTGERAVFVRLAGCNLQCPGCDTEYTSGRTIITALDIAEAVREKIKCRGAKQYGHLVVITGGEPFRQPIGVLLSTLLDYGWRVQVETNGVFAPDYLAKACFSIDRAFLVCSPKTSRIHESIHGLATAFKYVLNYANVCQDDGLPTKALGHKAAPFVARPSEDFTGRIYVNPEDSKDPEVNAANNAAVARSCIKHGYIAGVQLHKLLDLE